MFSTAIIYAVIFISLRRRSAKDSQFHAATKHRATPLMILYPLVYTICTAPLAAGRIYALAGHNVSLAYYCAAGTMIACNGWLDVLLYASTRAEIVFSDYKPGADTGLDTFGFMGKGHKFGTTTTIEGGGDREAARLGRSSHGGDSVENLYGLNNIGVRGEVSVTVDVVGNGQSRRGTDESASWDTKSGKSDM